MAIEPKKHAMPAQEPIIREKNFKEVALGYTAEIAKAEANRCLGCKNKPCVSGCPVNIDIPDFIAQIKKGDYEAGYSVFQTPPLFRPFAEESVRRNRSAKSTARSELNLNPLQSEGLNALLPIGTTNTAKKRP